MRSVLQTWVMNLPLMQQSVLLTAIRGCDGLSKRHSSKYLLRWLRRGVLLSAFDRTVLIDPHDPRGGNFTGPIPREDTLDSLADRYLNDIDEVPHHFHLHLVHAAEILGYKAPLKHVREFWQGFYERTARDMHMKPETEYELDDRLGDDEGQWRAAGGEHLDLGREVTA